jgi:hypothetical protein
MQSSPRANVPCHKERAPSFQRLQAATHPNPCTVVEFFAISSFSSIWHLLSFFSREISSVPRAPERIYTTDRP